MRLPGLCLRAENSHFPWIQGRTGRNDANHLPYLSCAINLRLKRRGRSQRDEDASASGEL